MKKRKWAALVLSVAMILTMLPTTVFAKETKAEAWDGKSEDTSWYAADKNTYEISNASQLAGLSKLVGEGTNFKGKTISLTDDIDLNNKEWTPVGKEGKNFQGTFDGKNHVISNLSINTPKKSDVGLFGYTSGGAIKNFEVHNASVKGRMCVGVIAGTPYTADYENITISGKVIVEGYAYVGGACGKNAYGDFTNVDIKGEAGSHVKAESEQYRTYVGGLIGFMGEGKQTVKDCNVKIDVIGSTCDVGGILGILHYGNTLVNCTYEGNLTLTNPDSEDGSEFGALVGTIYNGQDKVSTTIKDCEATVHQATSGGKDVTDTITPHGDFYNKTESGSQENIIVDATVNGSHVTMTNAVAKVGDVEYKTLAEAFQAAKSGDTVEILRDVDVKVWNQINNVKNISVKGNGHTLTIAKVESQKNGDYLFYNADDLNVSDLNINFTTSGNGFCMNSGKLKNVHMTGAPKQKSDYAVFVGVGSKVEIDNSSFKDFGTAIYSQPTASDKATADIHVTNSQFTDCKMTICSYATNTVFTGNTVTGSEELSFAAKADAVNQDANVTYVITGNTFNDAGKIWFYGANGDDVVFSKNKVLGNTYISTEDMAEGVLDLNYNYWGGNAPSDKQVVDNNDKVSVEKSIYYINERMSDKDLNTYVPLDKIVLNKTELKLYVNESEQLVATFIPENATDRKLVWSSSDENVVTVDENGVVTAKGLGTAEVTVTSEDGKTAVCKVTVEEKKEEKPSPKPEDPSKPNQPNKPSQPQNPEGPKTADNSNILLYVMLVFAAGMGMAVYTRKRRNAEQ